ncbi:MAG: AI-2E family transporter [Oscillibacter sp.]|nr:AI-2E family transporter [Oscillibacter sp.]
MSQNNSNNDHSIYLKIGLAVFVFAAAILLFFDTFFGSKLLPNIWSQFFSAFMPIIYGAFLSYMLAPLINFFEGWLFFDSLRKARKEGKLYSSSARVCSIMIVWFLMSVLIYLLLSVLLPELYSSVMQLASNLETYYHTINGWIRMLFERFPETEVWLNDRMADIYTQIETYVSDMLSQLQTLMAAAGRGMINVMNFLKNLLIGVIVSIYFLGTKEQCAASGRRILYSLFSRVSVRWILRAVRRVDSIFAGFVRGKLLDSLIIGVLCFVGCSLLDFPYTPIISVFIGVTNIIPFFGPFLGAIPSVFLILLVSPMQAVYFTIFVLALQQLDGNVIGPKIIGDQTGLSSLWVIIAILVGGSFFGVAGMFFGVPVCACLRYAGEFIVRKRLENQNLPTDLMAYAKVNREPRPVKPFHELKELKPRQPWRIRIGKEEFRIGRETPDSDASTKDS